MTTTNFHALNNSPTVICYDVEYPYVPGAAMAVQSCHWTREQAESVAAREVARRKDLRWQDVRITRVRRVRDYSCSLIECPYAA